MRKQRETPRNATYKVKLAREVFEAVYNSTETLEEDNIGSDLAYLVGGILCGSYCEWEPDRPIVKMLRQSFNKGHRIWAFVDIQSVHPEGHAFHSHH